MRAAASRYMQQQPVTVKRQPIAQVQHFAAPLKGLDRSSAKLTGDPQTAPILTNWIVEEDRITVRPGYVELSALTGADANKPIETIIPYYGFPETLLLASATTLYTPEATPARLPLQRAMKATPDLPLQAAPFLAGFTSGDWSWTSFSNLSDVDFTVMVNGKQGVWSWNGGTDQPQAVTVTALANTNPARCTVAAADILKFYNGQVVTIAGATGGHAAANGNRVVMSHNSPTNTFQLTGVDLSGATGSQTTGVTATIPGSIYKEPVTASAGALHIVPNNFHIVLSHQHRLWFADQSNLSVFYLPLQQKSGEVAEIPMNAIFKRGGSIRALYTWSIDGGAGMEDQLVIFTSNGEVAIYGGIDPESDMTLVGVFRFDSPMSKHCVANWGGELWVLCNTGLIPLSTMIRAESEKLGKTERNVVSIFETISQITRKTAGWSVLVDHSSGRVICNMPVGSVNTYRQMVRLMLRPVWSMWASVPARCWAWVDNRLFFGSDTGKFCEMAPIYLSDANTPIRADVQCAWSAFKTSAIKQFKMVLPYTITDGVSKPYVDFRVDYDERAPINQPDVTFGAIAAMWDTAMWDVDYWSIPNAVKNNWSGVAAIGRVGAPRLTVLIVNCKYSITGWDVLYESGSVFG